MWLVRPLGCSKDKPGPRRREPVALEGTETASRPSESRGDSEGVDISKGGSRTLRKIANCFPRALARTCSREGISLDPTRRPKGPFPFAKSHENPAKRSRQGGKVYMKESAGIKRGVSIRGCVTKSHFHRSGASRIWTPRAPPTNPRRLGVANGGFRVRIFGTSADGRFEGVVRRG